MSFSKIDSLTSFQSYLSNCRVVAKKDSCRIGPANGSDHTIQSLLHRFDLILRNETLFSPIRTSRENGKILITAGISKPEHKAILKKINAVLDIIDMLKAFKREINETQPKKASSKVHRFFSRFILFCRFGSQPSLEKLNKLSRGIIEGKIEKERELIAKTHKLPNSAKSMIKMDLKHLNEIVRNSFKEERVEGLSSSGSSSTGIDSSDFPNINKSESSSQFVPVAPVITIHPQPVQVHTQQRPQQTPRPLMTNNKPVNSSVLRTQKRNLRSAKRKLDVQKDKIVTPTTRLMNNLESEVIKRRPAITKSKSSSASDTF